MKLVREYIYEEFIESSDPIEDMEIGGFNFQREIRLIEKKFDMNILNTHMINVKLQPKVKKYWKEHLENWFLGQKVKGIMASGNENHYGALLEVTTSKVSRIELLDKDAYYSSEDILNFVLITIHKGIWKEYYKAEDEKTYWQDPDEFWYYVTYKDYFKRFKNEYKLYIIK